MLQSLDIRDMLIIDRLELNFQPGLNVLTGETGAGKSILLDALGFVLGWRGRAELVRTGAKQGEVTAVFDLSDTHPAKTVLEDAGLPVSDELILRRVNMAEGRKTAWVNDRRVSGEVLRALSDVLVELHGQQDDRGLLNPRAHRALLDDFGGLLNEVSVVRKCWRDLTAAQAELSKAEVDLTKARAEEDFLRHTVAELDELSPEPGEEASLDAKRRLMQAAGRIRDDVTRAQGALGHEGAEGRVGDAFRWLEGVADQAEGRLDEALAALSRTLTELGEAEAAIASCLDAMNVNPSELELAEERLFAIRALSRKHAVAPDELAMFADAARQKLDVLDRGADNIAALRSNVKSLSAAYDQAAEKLTTARKKAAKKLDAAMSKELAPLKMERAEFATEISESDAGPAGKDAVLFQVATNPGAPAGPLNKIASGGELSRFLLALKVCLTSEATGLTMIFDEIDRGVGGATADAVGRRLAALADEGQVLVVTHSPQVAARGAHHWQVAKGVRNGATLSKVAELGDIERVDEIARMLSGDRITDEARAAARALLTG